MPKQRSWPASAAALVLMASAVQARAADYVIGSSVTSYSLAQACNRSHDNLEQDFCTGYILGAMDQMAAGGKICLSGDAVTGRAMAVARKYISDHPERWNLHPMSLVFDALQSGFACPRAAKP